MCPEAHRERPSRFVVDAMFDEKGSDVFLGGVLKYPSLVSRG